MNEDIKPAWLDLSDTRLRKHLRAQKYPEPFIENILFRVRRDKAERRRSRIKTTVTHQMWDDVLRPAGAALRGGRRESVANEQVKKVASVMAILPSWVLNE